MPRPPSWPHSEAASILKRFPEPGTVVLETGYGPSGAPHIGTFAEVARTSWVGRALEQASGRRWELIAFSDDMDGLRKVPLNMPREALEPHLGKPLSRVPDPMGGCHASYGAHNNARLCEMLDRFGFRYTFTSSTRQYESGAFNDGLTRILRHYDEIREVILPTLRESKRKEWSPFLPICEQCGRVNGTRVTEFDAARLTVSYVCEGEKAGAVADERPDEEDGAGPRVAPRESAGGCGNQGQVTVLDGHVKVGWKVDWALRWFALGIQYEMYGKDLIESADLSARICQVISEGKSPGPVRQFYEMFLDEEGRKISKSVGRGLTVDTWLSYAPRESLLLFIFKDPRKAKKLSWDVVARSADEYLTLLQRHYAPLEGDASGANTSGDELAFIQPGLPQDCQYEYPVSYSMLLGLASAGGAQGPEVLVDFVHRYKGVIPGSDRMLEMLAQYATAYVREQLLPGRKRRELTPAESGLVMDLVAYLAEPHEAEEIQAKAFDIARGAGWQPGEYFKLIYNVLTGQDHGPRLGSFAKLLGQERMAAILRQGAS